MTRLLIAILLLLPVPGLVLAGEIKLGEPLTLTEVTKISEINKNTEKYAGKRVLVEGMVINVCAARGCWMDISSDVPFEKIQVKVVDGEIVFPMEAKGRTARVEGIAEVLQLSQEEAVELARHQAMESGGTFDPATITGPVTYLRIRGLGAVIQ
jgi:hypothetical protein